MKRGNIVLSGFMASGKTTVGELISRMTGREMVDTDLLVEKAAGISIPEIFAERGEAAFRILERDVVAALAEGDGLVVALGGGAVLDPANVSSMKKNGVIYYLDVSADEVIRRVDFDGKRPLLGEGIEDVERLLGGRRRKYVETADAVVDTGGRRPQEIAGDIVADFRSRCGRVGEGGSGGC